MLVTLINMTTSGPLEAVDVAARSLGVRECHLSRPARDPSLKGLAGKLTDLDERPPAADFNGVIRTWPDGDLRANALDRNRRPVHEYSQWVTP